MFAFAPPAKVARTQRSPLSCMEASVGMSQLTAPLVAAADPFVSMGTERVRPMSIAEAEIRVGGVTIRPSVFLSGIGQHSCWIVDENTRLLRVWNMHKPFWQRSAPRMEQIPTFTRDEGLPLFVAELGPDEESLAFCTDYGAVSSLDHSVEFQFDCEDDNIIVSSFACKREEKAMLTAVGTTSGLVLVAIKTGGERIVLEFDRANPGVTVQTSSSSLSSFGSWWRSWLPGLTSAKKHNTASVSRSNGSVLSNEYSYKSKYSLDAAVQHEFTLLRFCAGKSTQVWAVSSASEVFLLDFGPIHRRRSNDSLIRPKWGTNVSSVLQRQGRVVAFDETTTQLCCLVYLIPCGGHEASLEIVMIDVKNGRITQTLSMQSIGSLARTVAETPLHHTKVYLDEMRQLITVISGHYCVRVNNNVTVRNPCSSEDVHFLRGIEYPLGSSLLDDDRIVTIDISGPVESVISADEVMDAATTSVTNSSERQVSVEACRMSQFTGRRENITNLTRNISSVLSSLRIDDRRSIDSAVLEAGEAVCCRQRPYEGNWARADLNVEDDNMVAHVTHSLVQRQQEHRRFLLTVLLHDEIEPSLQPQTIAQLLSMQEALLAMVAIRRLQNDSSYPLSFTNLADTTSATTTTSVNNNNNNNTTTNNKTFTGIEFDVLTPLYRQTPSRLQGGDGNATVNDYISLARSSFEREKCQQLLREAVIRVADGVRSEFADANPVNTLGTAAEIVFGEPGRLCMLLQALGEHFVETQRSVLLDHRTKFDEAMAVATIFLLVARAVDASREDMAKFYTVPDSLACMLWTSSELEHYGIQLQLASACTTLSNALAEVVATSNNTATTTLVSSHQSDKTVPLTWTVPLPDQLRLLDLIALVMHFSFRNHSQGSSSFYSDAIRCTLFREPFLREPLGYPFGTPKPASDGTLGAAVLHLCQELALEFTAGDILVSICLAEPVENPLQETRKYNQLASFCERNAAMYDIALHSLLSQRREWELQLLPELLPTYPSAGVARDAFLLQAAPHLAWLVVPEAYESLLADGLRPPPSSTTSPSSFSPSTPFAYGGDPVAHRSRCVALARLAWVAGGDSAGSSSGLRRLRLDAALVAAQRAWLLPETRDVALGAAEAVQRLLQVEKPAAWADAARIACHVSDDLRSDLMTQILRRAKQHDGDALSDILHNGASELEVARALEATSIGHVFIVATELQCTSLFVTAWTNVLHTREQQLLSSWLHFRAAGLVS